MYAIQEETIKEDQMITKKDDYDMTTEIGRGDIPLRKGGYICRIFKAEEKESKNGSPMVHIVFDIAEGDRKGYFMEKFKQRKEKAAKEFKEAKYPFEGQMWISTTDYEDRSKTSRKFKALCTSLEESGTQVWNGGTFNIEALKDAMIGIVFRAEEHEYNGNTYWRTIPWGTRSVDAIREGDFFVPNDKPIEEESLPEGFSNVSESDIPFK